MFGVCLYTENKIRLMAEIKLNYFIDKFSFLVREISFIFFRGRLESFG